jgi:hypothetical protein
MRAKGYETVMAAAGPALYFASGQFAKAAGPAPDGLLLATNWPRGCAFLSSPARPSRVLISPHSTPWVTTCDDGFSRLYGSCMVVQDATIII